MADAVEPGGDRQDRLPAAVAVELVHTLSFIHDDVIDADELRREVDSVHVEWDPSTAAMGKPAGSDLNGKKPTLVTIHAADAGVDVGALDAGGVEARRRELEAAGSLDYVREQADRRVSKALHELEHLPRSSARETLGALARYAVERDR